MYLMITLPNKWYNPLGKPLLDPTTFYGVIKFDLIHLIKIRLSDVDH